MCGIAGIHRLGDKPVPGLNALVNELLLGLMPRGTDAAGYLAMMDDGQAQLQRCVGPAIGLVRSRDMIDKNARTVLMHTRWATVGDANDPRNAHPVTSGTIAAVHNGTIFNDSEIFSGFNLPRATSVDSEVIPALVSAMGWENAKDALELMRGGAAIGMVNANRPGECIMARLSSFPLHYHVGEDFLIWASEAKIIETAWRKVFGKGRKWNFRSMRDYTLALVKDGELIYSQIPEPPKPKVKRYTKTSKNYQTRRNAHARESAYPSTQALMEARWNDDLDWGACTCDDTGDDVPACPEHDLTMFSQDDAYMLAKWERDEARMQRSVMKRLGPEKAPTLGKDWYRLVYGNHKN